YRDNEVEPTNPLGAMAARWDRRGGGPTRLHLGNLTVADTTSMVADLLRIDTSRAADLAMALFAQTMGNPYDTVELLNTLRHDGLLTPDADGWCWDVAALGERGRADVADLLAERADAVPPSTRALMDAMACLAFQVELRALEAATALSASELELRLTPALDDG